MCPDDETLKYFSLKFHIWQHSNEQSYIDYIERGILLEKMFRLYFWSKIKQTQLREVD